MSDREEINEEDAILDFSKLEEGPIVRQREKLKRALMQFLGFNDYFRLFPPVNKIRGSSSQVSSFRNAAVNEKQYMKAVDKHGLNDPKTFASKTRLNTAVRNFERETGMKWPLQ
jgi:hypothetical protein